MEKQPKISVIVPAYNVEKYLYRCVESILGQTFSDFELLLVDDGSPDNCGKICDECLKKDKRIRVFHQQNMGLSGARNTGIDQALGEYVVFIDPDDYVGSNYLLNLIALMHPDKDGRMGFGIQGYQIVKENGEEVKNVMFTLDIYQKTAYDRLFLGDQFWGMFSAWAKIYDLSFLNAFNIRFDVPVRFAEDIIFNLHCMEMCHYINIGDSSDYIYVNYFGTMSKMMTPFDSEYYTFVSCRNIIGRILKEANISLIAEDNLWKSIEFMIRRILKTDYHRRNENVRSQRIRHLKSLCKSDMKYLQKYYNPDYKFDRIGRYLLIHGFPVLYDFLFTILFKLKIQKMFNPPGIFDQKH
jgi:Glycosyltransferases involved in cell wall biogenesis